MLLRTLDFNVIDMTITLQWSMCMYRNIEKTRQRSAILKNGLVTENCHFGSLNGLKNLHGKISELLPLLYYNYQSIL